MKNTILLTLILILNITAINAQQYKSLDDIKEENLNKGLLSNEEFFEKAELIIEGKFLKYLGSYDAKGNYNPNDIYSEYIIFVKHVYKGDTSLNNDTICVVKKGGTIYKKIESYYVGEVEVLESGKVSTNSDVPVGPTVDRGLNISSDFFSILFFVKSDYPENPDKSSSCPTEKFKLLQDKEKASLKFGDHSWGAKNSWRFGKITGLNDLVFNDKKELHVYMQQFKGIKYPEKRGVKPLYDIRTQEQKDSLDLELEKRAEIGRKNNELLKKKLQKNLIQSSNVDNSLYLKIDNQQMIYDDIEDKYYFEFDILASTNNPDIYFDGAVIELSYNYQAFGTYIYNQDKLCIEYGSEFNNNNYRLYSSYDICPNCIKLTLGTNFIPPYNRVKLSENPIVMLHIIIEVLPNIVDIPSNINFINTEQTSTFSTFTLERNSNFEDFGTYASTLYTNPQPINLVTIGNLPVITTDLSSITKIAGIGDTLTVRGYNFGQEKGVFKFSAADNGGSDFLLGLDDQYYIEWTDTLIKVIVPSMVYKGYELDTLQSWSAGAGTGTIKIHTVSGDLCVSNSSLNIAYSLANNRLNENATIKRVYLGRKSCEHDFVFTLHSAYRDNTILINTIEAALNKWSELTNLSLALERDVSNNFVFVDDISIEGKNIIAPQNGSSALLSTVRSVGVFKIGNDTTYYRKAGSDIYISDIPTPETIWNYSLSGTTPAGEISFYECFLHELGHILLLGHINNVDDLMFYGINGNVTHNIIVPNTNSVPVTAALRNINESREKNWPSSLGFILIGTEKPYISIDAPGIPVICNNRSIILRSNYSENNLWSTGATTQSININTPGTYSLTVRKEHCNLSSLPLIVDGGNLGAAFSIFKPSCRNVNDGAIYPTITGGISPISYNWTGGNISPQTTPHITGLGAGQYNLVLRDSIGCEISYDLQLADPDPLSGRIATQGESADIYVNVSGGTAPYSYTWASSSNECYCVLSEEQKVLDHLPNRLKYCPYSVTITDDCGDVVIINIPNSQFKRPLPLSVSINVIKTDYVAVVSGGIPPYKYNWTIVKVPTPLPFSEYTNSNEVPVSRFGRYMPMLTVIDFCGNRFTAFLSGKKLAKELTNTINVFPNPSSGTINISGVSNASIYIYSSLSELVKTIENVNNYTEIDISNFSNGVYFLQIIDADGNNTIEKIILSK